MSILVAPFATRSLSWTVRGGIVLACAVMLGVAVLFSKRGSLAEALPQEAPAASSSKWRA